MLLAVGFLLAMILTGKLPETRQLARFEARGVLAVPPEQVRRVELHVGEHTITFVRLSDHAGWVARGRSQSVTRCRSISIRRLPSCTRQDQYG